MEMPKGLPLALRLSHHLMRQPQSGEALALAGFVFVAFAQATNTILARGFAGEVPPFSFAFFRWSIIALGPIPFAVMDLRAGALRLSCDLPGIAAAGFGGMFLCGAPVYIAGATTTAINICSHPLGCLRSPCCSSRASSGWSASARCRSRASRSPSRARC